MWKMTSTATGDSRFQASLQSSDHVCCVMAVCWYFPFIVMSLRVTGVDDSGYILNFSKECSHL